MVDLKLYYKARIDDYSGRVEHIQKNINLISILRLLTFVSGVALAIYLYRFSPWLTGITAILFCTCFIFLVRIFVKLTEKRNFFRNIITVNDQELMRLAGDIRKFDPGTEFLQDNHPYESDLDIFGHGSIFQILNRTSTYQGKIDLGEWLASGADEKEILLRQAAAAELKEKTEWRHKFQAYGMDLNETGQEIEEIKKWLEEKSYFLNSSFYGIIIYFLPSVTLTLLVLSFFSVPFNFFLFLIIIQLGINGINLQKINRQHRVMTRKYHLFSNYSKLFSLIEDEVFNSEKLAALKLNLISGNERTSKNIKSLARLIDNFDRRLNMIMGAVLNGLFLWDIHCIIRLEKWRNHHSEHIKGWLQAIAEFDALISFGGFWFNNPDYSTPILRQGEFIFKSKEISHPLINKAERISNDLFIEKPGHVILITGSNMAGKSTFLRSVGVNMILGMAGAPVCARYLEFTPIHIFTNMRIGDSILEKESTFYAELRKLKRIIDHFKSGGKALVILDEIFKGTNSKDKHLGSEILLRQLISYDANVLVATHDLDLCRLENDLPGNVENYHFEVFIENGQFKFDYIFHKGICKTMNAKELMKEIGISID
jgi:DNA mismatch repair ATPase MutS